MNILKTVFLIVLIIAHIPQISFAMESKEVNYCLDPESWVGYENLLK